MELALDVRPAAICGNQNYYFQSYVHVNIRLTTMTSNDLPSSSSRVALSGLACSMVNPAGKLEKQGFGFSSPPPPLGPQEAHKQEEESANPASLPEHMFQQSFGCLTTK